GAVPVRTLYNLGSDAPFQETSGIDDFDMKLGYAVTEEMTRTSYNLANPANVQLGVVNIRDENNNSVVQPDRSAHFVVYSHGENRRGAISKSGTATGGCEMIVMGVPTPGTAGNDIGTGLPPELENCDNNDGLFVSALQSRVDSTYFDDIVM